MRRITILFLLAVITLSCKPVNTFLADFDIAGITSEKAYVTVFGDKALTDVNFSDSLKPYINIENGHLVVSGETQQPSVLRITFSDDKRLFKNTDRGYFPNKATSLWMIAEPGLKASFSGDLTDKNYVDIYLDKGPENKMMAMLTGKLMPLLSESGDIAVKMTMDTTLTAEDRAALKSRSDELDSMCDQIRKEFINEHPSCIASLWLMEDMLVRSQIEPLELDPLLEKVDPKYYDNYFYYTVKNRVDGAKASCVGCPCPRVEGTDSNGQPFNIESLRGKYVIIDFWGTWCGACLEGMPAMKVLRDNNSGKLEIVGLAQDRNPEAWKKCIDEKGMNWPNLLIGKGEDDYVAKFNVQGFPTKILLDPEGTILFRMSGESEEFYAKVEEFIK